MTTKRRKSFYRWLMGYVKHDSMIGDLATDVEVSHRTQENGDDYPGISGDPVPVHSSRWSDWSTYLMFQGRGINFHLLEALTAAFLEYHDAMGDGGPDDWVFDRNWGDLVPHWRPKQSGSLTERLQMSPRLRYQILERDRRRCVICGATGDEERLHVDHIIPVSRGGETEAGNLQTLCVACNLGKGVLLPMEMIE